MSPQDTAHAAESTLPIPQFISNWKRKSCYGFRSTTLAGWLFGDIYKWVSAALGEVAERLPAVSYLNCMGPLQEVARLLPEVPCLNCVGLLWGTTPSKPCLNLVGLLQEVARLLGVMPPAVSCLNCMGLLSPPRITHARRPERVSIRNCADPAGPGTSSSATHRSSSRSPQS
jgi:hypothetical protein